MNRKRDSCVAFTGYRPEKIRLSSGNPAIADEIGEALRVVVSNLYDRGFRTFLSGMAEGFDLWAAAEVLNLKADGRCPEIELMAVIPFRDQPLRFSANFRSIYYEALANAAEVVVLSEKYYPGCYEARNDYLVDNASQMVCYFDGQPGGTKYTLSRARRSGIPVINIWEPLPLF